MYSLIFSQYIKVLKSVFIPLCTNSSTTGAFIDFRLQVIIGNVLFKRNKTCSCLPLVYN